MAGGGENGVDGVSVDAPGRTSARNSTRLVGRACGAVGAGLAHGLVDVGGGQDRARGGIASP